MKWHNHTLPICNNLPCLHYRLNPRPAFILFHLLNSLWSKNIFINICASQFQHVEGGWKINVAISRTKLEFKLL